jgi:hypothetical protein
MVEAAQLDRFGLTPSGTVGYVKQNPFDGEKT